MLGGNAFVMFNKELAHEVSVNSAIIFGQLCSSYESFGSKDMLTVRDGKEFFFLTSEVIENETALTYKQQLKAIKDLEEAGYIETSIMGQPARKYFHITDKIYKKFQLSSDKKEELDNKPEDKKVDESRKVNPTQDERESLVIPKGNSLPDQKVHAIKEIKEKEQSKDKNKKEIIENKEIIVNKEKNTLPNKSQISNKLILEYMKKGMSKELCFRVLYGIKENKSIKNFGAYLRTCLETTYKNSRIKHGIIEKEIEVPAHIKKIHENLLRSNPNKRVVELFRYA